MNFIDIILIILIICFVLLNNKRKKGYKNKRLTNAVNLLKSPDKLLANILIVNNLINVAIITLSAYFTWSSFGKSAYVFFILTFVVTAGYNLLWRNYSKSICK